MGNDSGKQLHTIIGNGAVIEGTITLDHSIRIDGIVRGKLICAGEIQVGSNGLIEADIEVNSASIGGKVKGNLIAKEKIELESKANLTGDIKTKDLIINEGAVFQGNCSMETDKKKDL
ncbi:MAG: polymer-forming cytoskeletal protein [bacterium]